MKPIQSPARTFSCHLMGTKFAKMHDGLKKKAPVQATGGGGFRYENAVAARFLLDLLGGTNALGVDFGRIARIGWLADRTP
jgi:hypothetical protein